MKQIILKKIIKCAENQTIPFNKIIIINDGSDDKSLSKILKYKRTNKIKIINNKVNLGINKSLNLALKFVKTKFFFIMSAGDIYSLNVLKWCKDIYDKNKDVGMICGNVEILNASYNKKIIRELPFKKNIVLYQCDFVESCQKGNVTFFGGGVLMKTKNVFKIGGYPMDLKWIADWYLYLILGMNFPFICVDKVFSTLTLRKNDYSKSLFDWKKIK